MVTLGLNGISNIEMARRAKVLKQAMSNLGKEMLRHELVVIDPNAEDSRCNIISLTDKGAEVLSRYQKPINY